MGKRSISGLQIEDLIEGTGGAAEKGNTVIVQAIGRLNKGEVFLSTYDYGQPLKFEAGGHKSLAGLSKGVIGMKVGGKRRIRISPHLGYRDMTMPANELYKIPVPAQSVLIFDIDLLSVAV
jgi:peptidylprolyl isomerase